MPLNDEARALFSGFSKLTREERYTRLMAMGALTAEDIHFLENGAVKDISLGEKLIENVIGYFQLPLGVATHFCIDGVERVIPLAVEETSIIAALSKTAKWIHQNGSITTSHAGDCILGQIQFAKIADFERFSQIFNDNKHFLIELANKDAAAGMVARGGGVRDMYLRRLTREDGGTMAVIHLTLDSCDAMGANCINQVLESLSGPIERLTGERASMCILSNLNDEKLASARVELHGIDPELGARIEEASRFAEMDPYRAATHNKGIMNGIDPVLIATGNDWRAVEAGVHAFAARSGQYQSLSRWRYQNQTLTGTLTAPLVAGIVGGVTASHPTAQMCLRMLNVESAERLSRILAAVGIVQNLGALRALCTEGIIQGHMKLHIDNLILAAGASEQERPLLKFHMQQWLVTHRRISLSHAQHLLLEVRKAQTA